MNAPEMSTREMKPERRGMFSSLRIRNYRLYFSGQVIAYIGIWIQRIAQDWLVLRVSDNSPAALGTAVALQFLPTLLFSLWAGLLADRMDKRRLLIGIQVCIGAQSLLLGILDLSGIVQLWQVYLLCWVLGFFSALESPVRQSFVAEMVGPREIFNASAMNATIFNFARLAGPAIAGYAITWIGTGWLFVASAASALAVVAGLAAIEVSKLFRGATLAREKKQVREGLRYIFAKPDLLMVMGLMFVVSTVGITFFISLALISVEVFHVQADGYGLLTTLFGTGMLLGSLIVARHSVNRQPSLHRLLWAAVFFGVLEVSAAFMPTYVVFGIALIPLGYASLLFLNTASALVQITVSAQMRGRVMGFYTLVMLGGNPIAGPMVGGLVNTFGGRSPFVVGGVVSIAAAAVCMAILMRSGRVERAKTELVGSDCAY